MLKARVGIEGLSGEWMQDAEKGGSCNSAVSSAAQALLNYRSALALAVLLAGFLALQLMLPLASAVRIGADEDFELSKATLCNHGHKLYTEIWDDQPPLDTFIIASIIKHVSHSALAPRLLTVASAALLIAASFILIRAVSSVLAASIATVALIASPGFLELSSSAMQEIPALAPIVTSLCLLFIGPKTKWHGKEIIAGFLFGFGLQMKLIGLAYLPIAALILWLGAPASRRQVVSEVCAALFAFGASMLLSFVALNYLTGNSLTLQLQQSWAAHFGGIKTFEYGAPGEHSYEWSVLLKNWDTTVPAVCGLLVLAECIRSNRSALLPIAWLSLTLVVFATHKPWWAYYYVHNALPICWCAGVGIAFIWNSLWQRSPQNSLEPQTPRLSSRSTGAFPLSSFGEEGTGEEAFSHTAPRKTRTTESKARNRSASNRLKHALARKPSARHPIYWLQAAAFGLFALCALAWMSARLYLEQDSIRKSPKLYTCLALQEIERFKPFTRFMFSDQPIYSFYADLPMPPHLAVPSLKRFWAGQMSNAQLIAELEQSKPGLILLCQDPNDVPYKELLLREYKLVYQDNTQRLFAHTSIAKLPPL